MNKTYILDWAEKKETKTGKAVINATLKDEAGVVTDKVSIWSDFPNFANLMTGHKVTGNLYTNDKGYKTLYPPKSGNMGNRAPNSGISRSGGNKVEVEKVRNENIKANMKWKAEGQAYGNSVTNAVNLTIALLNSNGSGPSSEDNKAYAKATIIYFRDFLLSESQKYQEEDMTVINRKDVPF